MRVAAAARGERLPPRPRRGRRLGAASRSSGSTTRTTRPERRRRSRSTSASRSSRATHDFLLCSDEAYSELWFDEPPRVGARSSRDRSERRRLPDALEALVDDRLPLGVRRGAAGGRSPRSRPTGPRPVRRRRSSSSARPSSPGTTRPTSSARATRTGASARCSSPLLARKGWRVAASDATMYLWVEVAGDETSEACAERLLRHGIVVAPGSYLGGSGEGYVRIALVADVRGVRAGGGDPRGGAVTTEETIAALDRGELRVAERSGDDWIVNEEAKQAILDYFRLAADGADRAGPVRVSRQDPAEARLCGAGRARRPAGGRQVRLVPLRRAS